MMRGKTVIVTGAAGGIGLATARQFARAGAHVIALDHNPIVVSIGNNFPHLIGVCCELTDEHQIDAVFKEYVADRTIDVLVNNAGINPTPSSLSNTSDELWQQLFDTNVTALYRISKAVLTYMQTGVIVNMSSILALGGAKSNAGYAATKGAIISLTRAMARDHAPSIRVNCVCPGAVQTAMFDEYLCRCDNPLQEKLRIKNALPLQRLGSPENIADAVYFLASDAASWITGQVLVVDGGDSA